MKTRKIFMFAGVLTVLLSAIGYGNQMRLFDTSSVLISAMFGQNDPNEIPADILYDAIFRMNMSLKEKADLPENSPERASAIRNYFKNKANLSDKEHKAFQEIADGYIRDVASIDERAITIIEEIRVGISNGDIPKNQPPPLELDELQRERSNLVFEYRENLQKSLGLSGFSKWDQFVKTYFLSRFQQVPMTSFEQE